jgi:predicted nucleic-acid-binding Zn-ribbon protein
MRNGTCPKCPATDVRITTVINQAMVPSAYQFDTYVCTACGYSEHYVADPARLAKAAAKWPSVSS